MATSAGHPPDTVTNLKLNTLLDGLFHAATYVFEVIGLALLWRQAHRGHLWWSTKLLVGTVLMGFGIFNVVEGIVTITCSAFITLMRRSPRAVDLLGYRLLDLGRGNARYRLDNASEREGRKSWRADVDVSGPRSVGKPSARATRCWVLV